MAGTARQVEDEAGRAHEVRLMRLVAEGDDRARHMLAARLCPRVRRVARGLLVDLSDADDAAQDALVEVLRAAASYRGESSIERWADRIAVRAALRFRRRARRARVDTTADAEGIAEPASSRDPGDRISRPLFAYLEELPEKERRVLFLKHALGYSLPEVADLVGAARSTTKHRLETALRRIRKAIRRDIALGTRKQASP